MSVRDEFPIGKLVRKAGGYDWPGKVCGYGEPTTGVTTINVENRLCPGTVHVFPPRQLVSEDRTDGEILEQVAARMLRAE